MEISSLVDIYNLINDAEKRIDQAKSVIADMLVEYGNDNEELILESDSNRVVIVHSEMVKYDEDGLRKSIGEELWEQISTSKISAQKLEKLVIHGALTADQVTPYMTLVPKKPYVRASTKTHETTSQSMLDELESS